MNDETKQDAEWEDEVKAAAEEEEKAAQEGAAEDKAGEVDAERETAPADGEQAPAEAEEGAPAEEPEAPAEPDYKAQLAEMENKYLRKLAEFDNYRKRMAREFNDVREQTRGNTVTDFLTVYDYFSMGMSAIKNASDIAILQQGMEMIWAEFQRVLEGMNVKVIESVGQPFDAKIHDAVSQEASETVPEGVVIRQWKPGFKMGEKLLRPAVVVVSSGKPAPAAPEPAEVESAPAEAAPKGQPEA